MAIGPIDLKLSRIVFQSMYNQENAENRSSEQYPERDSRLRHFLLCGPVTYASDFRERF